MRLFYVCEIYFMCVCVCVDVDVVCVCMCVCVTVRKTVGAQVLWAHGQRKTPLFVIVNSC